MPLPVVEYLKLPDDGDPENNVEKYGNIVAFFPVINNPNTATFPLSVGCPTHFSNASRASHNITCLCCLWSPCSRCCTRAPRGRVVSAQARATHAARTSMRVSMPQGSTRPLPPSRSSVKRRAGQAIPILPFLPITRSRCSMRPRTTQRISWARSRSEFVR